ncbi:MAG: dethiobiotin synthase [Gammaproteobacteria bacterium]|nr:dethiobiotin synthase [Gammaproteobacteria bacterium]
MSVGLFVTGTDTDCGKTHVARALIRLLDDQGIRVVPFKPVAAGAASDDGNLRNDDALALIAACGRELPHDLVNPYCFAPPIAPHIAAAEVGAAIDSDRIRAAFAALGAHGDVVIAEGAGGWLVPLGDGYDIADLAADLGLPVLLVVGLRLGCLNHARLTERAILDSGLPLAGWIATQVDPAMTHVDDNVAALRERLTSPCLGVLPDDAATGPPVMVKSLTSEEIIAATRLREG